MESEEQKRNLIQNLPGAVYTCDTSGNITFYNKAAVELWGREPIPGKDLWCGSCKLIRSDGTEMPFNEYPLFIALQDGTRVNGEEIIVQRPDGSNRRVLSYPSPVYNEEDKLTGGVNMLIDITDKREKPVLIDQAEEKYRKLIEQASDAILIYSFDGTIYEFNNSVCTLSGYTRREFEKLRLSDILIGDIIINPANHEAILKGDTVTLYRQIKRKDGLLIDMEVTARIMADGKVLAFGRDISERKRVEKALQESEEFSRSILKSITSQIAVVDENGTILSVNKAWNDFSIENGETVLERTGIGSNYIQVCQRAAQAGEAMSARVLDGFHWVIAKKIPFFEMEYPCHSPNEQRWFLLRITNFAGNSPKVVMTHIDISERIKTEEEIKKANERFELIARAANYALWELNLETDEVWGNEIHQQLYGLTLADAVPTDEEWKRRIHPDDREKVVSSIEEALASERSTWEGEYLFCTENKGWVHIYGQTYIVRNNEGNPVRILGSMIDITDRKNAQERMQKAINRYDILAQATSDTIWDWDIVNNKILYNDGMVKMFGYNTADVKEDVDWWENRIHPDDIQKVSGSVAESFTNRIQNFQLTYRFRCADQSYKYIYDRAFIIYDENKKPTRMIGAMQDVTYEKEEEQRMAKAIIDAQEKERSLIGRELHDNVNQILVVSLLNLGMAKEKPGDSEKISGFLEIARGCIGNAIDEVRKLSHELAPATFDDNSLKDIFENLLLNMNFNNRYAVNLHFGEIDKMVISEDIRINLFRILQEQLKNILKYSDASSIDIAVTFSENAVQMRIFDNGKGFNIKTVRNGIGLSNIKKRAESFSGKFSLNSAVGKGCELIVEIPLYHTG